MTLEWTPTAGHTYKIYERVNGVRRSLGQTTRGEFTVPNMSKGTHYYFVTVINAAGESLKSNEIEFVKRKR